MVWETAFDPSKDILIEIRKVSQKEVCRQRAKKILVGKRPRKELVKVNVTRYRPEKEIRKVLLNSSAVIYNEITRTRNNMVYVSLWGKMFG